jgi:acyl-CoA synthetase (AMP-forming)/AMP-acid ligase II
MDISISLAKAIQLWPDKTALIDGSTELTYSQFADRVNRLRTLIGNLGIGKGDVIAVIAPNCHQFMETYYAAAVSGVVLAPLNFRLAAREIAAILSDSDAQVLLAHEDFRETVVDACEQASMERVIWFNDEYETKLADLAPATEQVNLNASDLAHLYYTSGTTGKPKGVMLTHGNVSCHALSTIGELTLTDRDVWAHVAPMFHLADAWATFAITWAGGTHVFVPYFNASEVLQTFSQKQVTITNLIPTMLNSMVHSESVGRYEYSSLRCLLSGGAPIAPETVRKIISTFGCDYVQTYGMTETSPYLTLSLLKDHLKSLPSDEQLKYKSKTGRPFISVRLRVVRPDGSDITADESEVGEIIVQGPTVTPGYWKQPQATAEAILNGWLHTGDLATLDSEGYVNIVDRKKDMIITGGENVYSTEVENVLYEHPGVLECAVVGVPDETWGEIVKAVVVPRSGHTLAEPDVISFVRQRLAHYKSPRIVEFISALPRTGSGKIYKKALRDALVNK